MGDQLTALLERQVAELVAELAAHNESLQRQSDLLEKARREWSAALREKDARIDTLFDAIAHGDDQHRAWLRQAIDDHFSRPAQGEAEKDARIAALEAALRDAKSRTIALAAQVMRSTCEAPSNLSMAEIDQEWSRMRNAALEASHE